MEIIKILTSLISMFIKLLESIQGKINKEQSSHHIIHTCISHYSIALTCSIFHTIENPCYIIKHLNILQKHK